METVPERIDSYDWQKANDDMHNQGYALLSGIFTHNECDKLIREYNAEHYRKTITMERYRFGLGEYKYFKYPLPELIQQFREHIYCKLSPIANQWMKALNINNHFPDSFETLQDLCHKNNQIKPTALILKYGKGGHNTLHQDLYGEIFFPIQLVVFLSEPEEDYTGGEFILLEQRPRAQSKATVLRPRKGDMLIFTTNFRPVKGSKGYYRANLKHGVSEVHDGSRYTLGIIFHDAL